MVRKPVNLQALSAHAQGLLHVLMGIMSKFMTLIKKRLDINDIAKKLNALQANLAKQELKLQTLAEQIEEAAHEEKQLSDELADLLGGVVEGTLLDEMRLEQQIELKTELVALLQERSEKTEEKKRQSEEAIEAFLAEHESWKLWSEITKTLKVQPGQGDCSLKSSFIVWFKHFCINSSTGKSARKHIQRHVFAQYTFLKMLAQKTSWMHRQLLGS